MKNYFQLFSCILINKINFKYFKIIQTKDLSLLKMCTHFWQLINYVKTLMNYRVWTLSCNSSSSTTVAEHRTQKYKKTENRKRKISP